jgi:hypothetical protein
MLSAMNASKAATIGQRGSPRRDSPSVSFVGGAAAVTSLGEATVSDRGTSATTDNVFAEAHPSPGSERGGNDRRAIVSMAEVSAADRRLDLVSTLLLALATVATAWAAYQSREWTGEQALGTSRAAANRIAVNRAAAVVNRQVQIDVATFIQWVNAREEHRSGLATFYRERFRDEFRPAFAAWLATKPFENAAAPSTPFALPQYRLTASAEADRLEGKAAAASDHAKEANQRADNYMLAVVLFRDLSLLRRHQHEDDYAAVAYRAARARLRDLRRSRGLGRDLPAAAHDVTPAVAGWTSPPAGGVRRRPTPPARR